MAHRGCDVWLRRLAGDVRPAGGWLLAAGCGWRLAAGGWLLAAGCGWRLAAGGWRLAAGGWPGCGWLLAAGCGCPADVLAASAGASHEARVTSAGRRQDPSTLRDRPADNRDAWTSECAYKAGTCPRLASGGGRSRRVDIRVRRGGFPEHGATWPRAFRAAGPTPAATPPRPSRTGRPPRRPATPPRPAPPCRTGRTRDRCGLPIQHRPGLRRPCPLAGAGLAAPDGPAGPPAVPPGVVSPTDPPGGDSSPERR